MQFRENGAVVKNENGGEEFNDCRVTVLLLLSNARSSSCISFLDLNIFVQVTYKYFVLAKQELHSCLQQQNIFMIGKIIKLH